MAKVYYKVKIDGKWLFRRTAHDCECANCTYTEEDDPSEDYCRAVEEEE